MKRVWPSPCGANRMPFRGQACAQNVKRAAVEYESIGCPEDAGESGRQFAQNFYIIYAIASPCNAGNVVEFFTHASIRSCLRIVRPESVANLDQVTIRVSEVYRKELSCRAFAHVWTSKDVDTHSAKQVCDILHRLVCQDAEVSASWHSVAGDVRR